MTKISRNVSQPDLRQPNHQEGQNLDPSADSAPSMSKRELFRDDTMVHTKEETAAANDYSSLQCGNSPSSTGSEEFRANLDRHLEHLWGHDRLAAVDQLGTPACAQHTESSPTTNDYAKTRRRELSAIPGSGHWAKQYGLQIARDGIPPTLRSGLRVSNPLNAAYQRTEPGTYFHELCSRIYRSLGHHHPSQRVLFANSKTKAASIIKTLQENHPVGMRLWPKIYPKSKTTIKPLKPGLVAIELGRQSFSTKAQKHLVLHGGRPSAYQVNKLTHASDDASVRKHDGINNVAAFRAFADDLKETINSIKTLPDGHALQATAHCAVSLLQGLETTLSAKINTPNFKHDLLVASALDALAKASRVLPALTEDSTRFTAAYTVLLEEMHLLLAVIKPYAEVDFKQATAKMLEKRAPALAKRAITASETFLFSSGMDAISAGMDIAKKLTGKTAAPLSSREPFHEYYEIISLATFSIFSQAIVASLNSSLPAKKDQDDTSNEWNADKLTELAQQWLKYHQPSAEHPAVLVLDTTIEQQKSEETSDLDTVLEKLAPAIEEGKLKIVLCKSYQKYTSLGSAKIMAGGITYIGSKNDATAQAVTASLREAEQDLGWMGNDESQLLTHFLAHASRSELEMLGQAAKNARFLRDFCLAGMLRSPTVTLRHEAGLPFVFIKPVAVYGEDAFASAATQQNLIQFATETPKSFPAFFPVRRQVAIRGGFAFLSSSFADISNSGMRISAGQETPEELVEKLYAYGWVGENKPHLLTPGDFSQQAQNIAAQAMEFVLGQGDVSKWAPAALQVLRERATDGATIRECENLLYDKGSESKLRERLATALMASVPEPNRLLSQQLRIVGRAFAPRLDDSVLRGNDIYAMRATLHNQGSATSATSAAEMQAHFAPNAVASLLEMAGQGFGPENVDHRFRPELESLYQAFFDSGLPGVSAATREHLLCDWSRLQTATLEKTDNAQTLGLEVQKWGRYAQLCPYRETRAKMFAAFPDQAFARLTPSSQRQLINVLFRPLDVTSRAEFVKTLARNKDFAKLKALECFGEKLPQADNEGNRE